MKKRKFLAVVLPVALLLTGCGGMQNAEAPESPEAPTVEIGSNGTWVINGTDTGVNATGNGVSSVEKTSSDGKVDTYTITFTDGSTTTFTVTNAEPPKSFDTEGNTITKDALAEVQSRVSLEGTLLDFVGENATKGSETKIDVSFTEDSYFYSGVDELGSENTGYIFKIGGIPTICGINMQNERVFSPMTDDDGNVESWEHYANPFAGLTLYDFVETEEAGVYDLHLDDSHMDFATEFVARLTNYSFPSLSKLTITLEEGQISAVHVETPDFDSMVGPERFIIDLKVTARADEVEDLAYPEPYATLPEHEKLRAALEKIQTTAFSGTYEHLNKWYSTDPWEDADILFNMDVYFTDKVAYIYDKDYLEGTGYILEDDGKAYLITYEPDAGYLRSFYPTTDSDGNPLTTIDGAKANFGIAAPEIFKVIDDKHFELTGTFASSVAYYYDFIGNMYASGLTKLSITLDDNYDIKTIVATDELFDEITETVTAWGDDVKLPFDEATLPVEPDPFTTFTNTYTCKDSTGEVLFTINVNSLTDITVNDMKASSITFDGSTHLVFDASGYEFDISKYTYGGFSISVEGLYDDFYGYYSEDYDTLVVA